MQNPLWSVSLEPINLRGWNLVCNLLSYGRNIMNFSNKFKEPSATGLCDFTWNDPDQWNHYTFPSQNSMSNWRLNNIWIQSPNDNKIRCKQNESFSKVNYLMSKQHHGQVFFRCHLHNIYKKCHGLDYTTSIKHLELIVITTYNKRMTAIQIYHMFYFRFNIYIQKLLRTIQLLMMYTQWTQKLSPPLLDAVKVSVFLLV